MRMNHDLLLGGSLLGLGFGLGMVVADFAARWMGWDGSSTLSMVGALLAWACVFGLLAARGQERPGTQANRGEVAGRS